MLALEMLVLALGLAAGVDDRRAAERAKDAALEVLKLARVADIEAVLGVSTIGETSHLGQPFGLSSLYQSHLSAASSRRSIALVHTSHTVRHFPRVTRG
jgi:hypothetical protein